MRLLLDEHLDRRLKRFFGEEGGSHAPRSGHAGRSSRGGRNVAMGGVRLQQFLGPGEPAFEVFRHPEVSGITLCREDYSALNPREPELSEIFPPEVSSGQVPGTIEQRERVGLGVRRQVLSYAGFAPGPAIASEQVSS